MENNNPKKKDKSDKWGLVIGITAAFVTAGLLHLLLDSGLQKPVKISRVERAGPLETSFCPEIPTGLFFGDSYESIVEKMRRPPDERRFVNGRHYYYYLFHNNKNFDIAAIAFSFIDDSLNAIAGAWTKGYDGELSKEGIYSLIGAFSDDIAERYGSPGIIIDDDPESEQGVFEVKYWQFDNNAVLLGPGFDYKNESLNVIAVVCPLEPSGHYNIYSY